MENNIVILIPSYNPTNILIDYLKELYNSGFHKIIVVNDGSKNKQIFEEIKNLKYCVVLTHQINLGKGAALKTGFRYYTRNLKDKYRGIVTLDDDKQHSIKDALKLIKFIDDKSLILGSRNFNLKIVPFKSKMGNKITSFMFKLIYKKKLTDTQTGLRLYPNQLLEKLCYLDGNRFDFETNVLIYCIKKEINIIEITIDTIYIDKNRNSRFKPFEDSVKIYKIFFKGRKKYNDYKKHII